MSKVYVIKSSYCGDDDWQIADICTTKELAETRKIKLESEDNSEYYDYVISEYGILGKQPDLEGKLVYHKGGKMYEVAPADSGECEGCSLYELCRSTSKIICNGLARCSIFKEIKGEG